MRNIKFPTFLPKLHNSIQLYQPRNAHNINLIQTTSGQHSCCSRGVQNNFQNTLDQNSPSEFLSLPPHSSFVSFSIFTWAVWMFRLSTTKIRKSFSLSFAAVLEVFNETHKTFVRTLSTHTCESLQQQLPYVFSLPSLQITK